MVANYSRIEAATFLAGLKDFFTLLDMPAALLTTKFYFPTTRPSLVKRPRLVQRLQAGLRGPVTLISAPAGSGKTTLVSEWREGPGAGMPVAWLSLDEVDNDPTRFLAYLLAALETLKAGLTGGTSALLLGSPHPPIETIMTDLLNALGGFPQEIVLALDDLHVITDKTVHQALGFLLDHQPPGFHLLFLTRADPPLALSRLRARGQLTEIRMEHLRFSVDEAASFLNQAMGLDLTSEQVVALEKRSEGWIVGLQMAALSLQGRKDMDGFISSFTGSNVYILDYLGEEVLHRQDDILREFLMETSILKQLTGPLCDALTLRTDGQAMLDKLSRLNLFMLPLDDEGIWYRYHNLFASVLLHQLNQLHPDRVPILNDRASQWYEKNGALDQAIEHALQAGNGSRAIDLMDKTSEDAFRQEEVGKLLGWVRRLPAGAIFTKPRLCVYYAWAVVVAEKYSEARETLATGLPANIDHIRPEALDLARRVAQAQGKDQILQLMDYAQKALDVRSLTDNRSEIFFTQGLTYAYWHMGEIRRTEAMARESLQLAEQIGYSPGRSLILGLLARTQVAQGKLRQAHQNYQRVLDETPAGTASLAVCQALAGLTALDYEWNNLVRASDTAVRCLEYSRQTHHGDIQFACHRLLARIHQAQGEAQAAREDMEQARQVASDFYLPQIMLDMLAATWVVIGLAQGDLATAQHWMGQLQGQIGSNFHLASISLERARLYLAQGDKRAAMDILADRYKAVKREGLMYAQIDIRILQSCATPNEGEALAYLAEALHWAEPEGYIRVFVDQGPALIPLLNQAGRMNVAPAYTVKLLAAFNMRIPGQRGFPAAASLGPLSRRELELLHHIAAGCSNKEIASQLFISLATVKRHTVNIYNKLDVKNRTEAVARARELGLL